MRYEIPYWNQPFRCAPWCCHQLWLYNRTHMSLDDRTQELSMVEGLISAGHQSNSNTGIDEAPKSSPTFEFGPRRNTASITTKPVETESPHHPSKEISDSTDSYSPSPSISAPSPAPGPSIEHSSRNLLTSSISSLQQRGAPPKANSTDNYSKNMTRAPPATKLVNNITHNDHSSWGTGLEEANISCTGPLVTMVGGPALQPFSEYFKGNTPQVPQALQSKSRLIGGRYSSCSVSHASSIFIILNCNQAV